MTLDTISRACGLERALTFKERYEDLFMDCYDIRNALRTSWSLTDLFKDDSIRNLSECVEVVRQTLLNAGLVDINERALKSHVAEMFKDFITRHQAPWAGEGLKDELKDQGIPVTQDAVLDEFFAALSDETLSGAVQTAGGFWSFAIAMSEGKIFNDPYEGNFKGYRRDCIAQAIEKRLKPTCLWA